jgi:hypothetical protein
MSNIEDILNASDSDGELDTKGLDIEGLLDGDSDEEISTSKSAPPKTVTTVPKATSAHTKIEAAINTNLGRAAPVVEPIKDLLAALESAKVDSGPSSASSTAAPPKPDVKPTAIDVAAPPSDLGDAVDDISSPVSAAIVIGKPASGLLGGLEMARRREQRNVAAGNRDVVTALFAKLNKEGGSASLSHLKSSDLEAISSQLKRNAQYKQHGPGTALVLYVHLKFIAVGTSRGLILLFDHFQEIRQVIGSNTVTAAQSVKTNAGVTAIDCTPQAETMIAGYENGEILLWDVAKGIILKRLTEMHRSKVIRLKFIQNIGEGGVPPAPLVVGGGMVGNLINAAHQSPAQSNDLAAVSVDTEGVVHRIRFSKVIWTSYTIENDCLLDGKTGNVLDLTVLSPVPPLARLQPAALSALQAKTVASKSVPTPELSIFGIHHTTQWTAFSTATRTYIVQVRFA